MDGLDVNVRWDDLKLFLAVYEQGSLSGAARVLKLGQPTLSRRIAELEEAVGEPLFERKNHGAELTAIGLKLLPAAQGMAEWASEARRNLKMQSFLPEGKVRIAAPPGIAYELVAPLACKIRQQYSQVQLEVLSGVEILNLKRGEADLSLRTTPPSDAELACLDQITSPMRAYANRNYKSTLPPNPGLNDIDWISWASPYLDLQVSNELSSIIPDFRPVFTSDDYNVQIAACKAGVGAMILPELLYRRDVLGEWQVLEEIQMELGPAAVGSLYLVCHKRMQYLPKIRMVSEFIMREFENMR